MNKYQEALDYIVTATNGANGIVQQINVLNELVDKSITNKSRMTAKEMFEKLGFKQVLCINLNQKDGKQVIYESVIGDNDTLLVKRIIHFFDDVFYASLHYYNDETETFENQGGCSINNELLKAINKQCEELG